MAAPQLFDILLLQGMLPPEAQDTERVRAQLTWALNAMNSAMEGVPLQYAQPAPTPAVGAGYAYAGAAGGILPLCFCGVSTDVQVELSACPLSLHHKTGTARGGGYALCP